MTGELAGLFFGGIVVGHVLGRLVFSLLRRGR
jgi:hypothetical protein